MRQNLTFEQYHSIWCREWDNNPKLKIRFSTLDNAGFRMKYWQEQRQAEYKIEYIESVDSSSIWGALIGSSKDINWFLLGL